MTLNGDFPGDLFLFLRKVLPRFFRQIDHFLRAALEQHAVFGERDMMVAPFERLYAQFFF